jgi:hypothetical protein
MSAPDTRTVVLALSPSATDELVGYIERGGQPADAQAGHPQVIDDILGELRGQRDGLEPAPTNAPTKAQKIAGRMAKAAAEAVDA